VAVFHHGKSECDMLEIGGKLAGEVELLFFHAKKRSRCKSAVEEQHIWGRALVEEIREVLDELHSRAVSPHCEKSDGSQLEAESDILKMGMSSRSDHSTSTGKKRKIVIVIFATRLNGLTRTALAAGQKR
jgi:hypothetical protein